MSKVVDRIRAKVARAKQHIADFQLGLSAFYSTNPYRGGIKHDTQTGTRIYYVAHAESVPDSLATIAADIVQNLRSPLDQIAYQLVMAANNGIPPDKDVVYYPITSAHSEYPALRNRNMQGVRQCVIDVIDATEPYKGGKGHAIWQLNELNKTDKHRLLVSATSFFDGVDIGGDFRPAYLHPAVKSWDISFVIRPEKLRPMSVGDELYREPFTNEVNKNRKFAFHVTLNQPGVIECEPALKTFQDMANLIDATVIALGRFLP